MSGTARPTLLLPSLRRSGHRQMHHLTARGRNPREASCRTMSQSAARARQRAAVQHALQPPAQPGTLKMNMVLLRPSLQSQHMASERQTHQIQVGIIVFSIHQSSTDVLQYPLKLKSQGCVAYPVPSAAQKGPNGNSAHQAKTSSHLPKKSPPSNSPI